MLKGNVVTMLIILIDVVMENLKLIKVIAGCLKVYLMIF